jgi:hypothetical protein
MQLLAERVVKYKQYSCNNTCYSFSFFSLNSKEHGYLTYIKCVFAVSEAHKQNTEPSNLITIFHQNIRGLRNKSDELMHSFKIDAINTHILFLSEHHMVKQDMLHLPINGYLASAEKGFRGKVCVFMLRMVQHFIKIDTLL